jgi:pyruvate formate lyase activating enzyme
VRDAAKVSDLVLFDLKLMDDVRHEAATGVSNASILRNLAALAATHANVWIRIPVVPNVNDDDENISATVDYLATLPSISHVDLLPYHPTGEAKFARLGKHYPLHGTRTPSADHMASIAARFVARGFQTTIGGQAA